MNNSTVVTKLQILSSESPKLTVVLLLGWFFWGFLNLFFYFIFSKTQNSSLVKMFSLNAILNGNKWLLCLQELDAMHDVLLIDGYCISNIPTD